LQLSPLLTSFLEGEERKGEEGRGRERRERRSAVEIAISKVWDKRLVVRIRYVGAEFRMGGQNPKQTASS
jgi:hypothetical protein